MDERSRRPLSSRREETQRATSLGNTSELSARHRELVLTRYQWIVTLYLLADARVSDEVGAMFGVPTDQERLLRTSLKKVQTSAFLGIRRRIRPRTFIAVYCLLVHMIIVGRFGERHRYIFGQNWWCLASRSDATSVSPPTFTKK